MRKARISEWVADGLAVAGAAGVGYGLWLIYPPAMWIVMGLMVLAVGMLLGRR